MFKPRLRLPRASLFRPLPTMRRCLHDVPNPGYTARDGIPGMLSAEGFDIAWTQYMDFVVSKLNALTAGTEMAEKETKAILKMTAREPSQAPIFNYASMAHNNHFFFRHLNDKGQDGPVEVPRTLRNLLESNFSSMETLRREMILTASAMFGPGFVWLVRVNRSTQYRILTTYLAGSPYHEAHWRRQGIDMNTAAGPASTEDGALTREYKDRTALGSGGDVGTRWNTAFAPGGTDVIPILCVNTWEHVWLRDYGFGEGGMSGKRLYLENWWNAINWDVVYNSAQIDQRNSKMI